MSIAWNNDKRLDMLNVYNVYGDENELVFETEHERAEVLLENNEISEVVCSVKGRKTVIKKDQSHHIVVGEGNTQRDVYHFLKPDGPSPSLRLGITRHRGIGTWSSLPHDFELKSETGFEEVFFYILEGGTKVACQVGRGVWFDGSRVDQVWYVRDRSWSTIPMGYHPVVGEPGVEVSYVWAYLAKKKEWEKI